MARTRFALSRYFGTIRTGKDSFDTPVGTSGDKSDTTKTAMHKEQIIKYMTDHATVRSSEIATLLGITVSRVKVLLADLQSDGIIMAEGANRNRVYRLKY